MFHTNLNEGFLALSPFPQGVYFLPESCVLFAQDEGWWVNSRLIRSDKWNKEAISFVRRRGKSIK